MNILTRSNVYLPMAAIILTATLAAPAAAQRQVPFKGAFEGHDVVSAGPSGTILLATTATGTGSHLGHFSFTQELTLAGPTSAAGSGQWVAANGDIIYTTQVSSAELGDMPDQLEVTEIHTITGGTGRFADAEGSFTVTRIHLMVPVPGLPSTFVTYGSFHGTITSPGGARRD